MGRESLNDFVLDTKGKCFFCMDILPPPLIKLAPGDPPDPTPAYVIQHLSRFLKMDMMKVFKDKTSISPQLLAKVQNSKLKTDLCEECLKLSQKFSKLHRKLEKVRMEVDFCLAEIQQKLKEAKSKNETVKLEDVLGGEPNFADDLFKLEVVEVLRREAASQCTAMLSCPFPRIKVQNMTKEEIRREVLKTTSASGKTAAAWNETASISSIKSTIGGSHDMDVEISEVKQERNSPNFAVDTKESGDWIEFDNYSRFGSDDDCDEGEPDQKYTETATKSSTQTLGLETPHTKGGMELKVGAVKKKGKSFSGVIPPPIKIIGKMGTWQSHYIKSKDTWECKCRLCPKTYTIPTNFRRHYKRIHAKQKFKCGVCGIEYPYKQKYELHYLSVHAGVRYQCGKCNRSFTQQQSLDRHNNSAHLGRRAFCKFCSKSFSESFTLKAHMRKCHSNKFNSQAPLK